MKYLYILLLFLITLNIGNSQNCRNGDFEAGDFSGWTADRSCNFGGIPIGSGTFQGDRLCCNEIPGIGTSLLNCQHLHSIQNAGNNDGFLSSSANIINTYTLPVVPLTGGNFSARLGNDFQRYAAERISRTITVPSNETIYFKYAIVMDESHSNITNGNINGTEVFFLARVLDGSGTEITRFEQVGSPSNSFIQQRKVNNNQWCEDNDFPYRRNCWIFFNDWECVALNLPGYAGSSVTLEFINSDCDAGGHMGYTYIDDVCVKCDTTQEEPIVEITAISDTCISENNFIQGNFTLPVQGGNTGQLVSLDLLIYQNGSQVNSVNVSSYVSGTNFSIPLDPSFFNGVMGECFDIFVQGTFTLVNPYSGQTQTLVEVTDLLALGHGVTVGLNNDVCICNIECCEMVYVNPSASNFQIFPNLGTTPPTTWFYMDLNFVAGPNLITEVSAFIEDFYITFNHEDCGNCFNPPINWGSIAITDPVANNNIWDILTNTGLVNPYPYFSNPDVNIREVVWSDLSNPRDFTSGAPIRWHLFLPTITEIPCCVIDIELCITFIVTDIDCNVCEYSFCGSLPSYDANGFSRLPARKNNLIPFGLDKIELPENKILENTEIEEFEKAFKIKIEN